MHESILRILDDWRLFIENGLSPLGAQEKVQELLNDQSARQYEKIQELFDDLESNDNP